MVGKNNTLVAEQKRSDKHCHYGIRKLSVGVASVLLGVGFFAGNSVAHADTTDTLNDNKDADTKNSNKIDTSQDVYGTQQNSASQTVSSQVENVSTQANVTSSAAVGSTDLNQATSAAFASQSSVNNSKKESNLETSDASSVSMQGLSESKVAIPGVTIPASQDGNVAEKNNVDRSDQNSAFDDSSTVTGQNQLSASVVNFNVDSRMINFVDDNAIANNVNESKVATDNSPVDHQDGMANKALIGQGVSQTVTLSDGSTLTTQYDQLDDTHPNSFLTFKSSSFKAGDTYTIKIPKNNGLLLTNADVAKLQPSFGTTTFDDVSDNDYYLIIDKFIATGSVVQTINLSRQDLNEDQFANYHFSKAEHGAYDFHSNAIVLTKNDDSHVMLTEKTISEGLSAKLTGNYYASVSSLDAFDADFIFNHASFNTGFNFKLEGLSSHLPKTTTLSKLEFDFSKFTPYVSLSSIDYCDFNGKVISSSSIVNGRAIFSRPELINAANDVLDNSTMSFVLHGVVNVPDNLFNRYQYDISSSQSAVQVTATDFNGVSATASLNVRGIHVVDGYEHIPEGEVIRYSTSYMAGFLDGDYTNGKFISKNAVPVFNYLYSGDSISSIQNFILRFFSARISSNIVDYPLHNAKLSWTIPDGMNFRITGNNAFLFKISVMSDFVPSSSDQIMITYRDGSSVSVPIKTSQEKFFNGHKFFETFFPSSPKKIRSIEASIANFRNVSVNICPNADPQAFSGLDLSFARNYADGSPVDSGDLFKFKTVFTANNMSSLDLPVAYVRAVDHNVVQRSTINSNTLSDQRDKSSGVSQAGHIVYQIAPDNGDSVVQLTHPILYIRLPNNAVPDLESSAFCIVYSDSSSTTHTVVPKNVSMFVADNGIAFLKLDLSNRSFVTKSFNVFLPFGNAVDFQSSKATSNMFIYTDDPNTISNIASVDDFKTSSKPSDVASRLTQGQRVFVSLKTLSELPPLSSESSSSSRANVQMLDSLQQLASADRLDANNLLSPVEASSQVSLADPSLGYTASIVPSQSAWQILASDGMSSATMTSSNLSRLPSRGSLQNDHGVNADRFKLYSSIINATDVPSLDTTQIINLPDSADGHSQFAPKLTGPIELINANTNADLTSLVEITYSTHLTNLSKADDAVFESPMTADQVQDWSKVKSVLIRFVKPLPVRTSVRAVLNVVDPNVYDHVNQTLYVSSVTWAKSPQKAVLQFVDDDNNSKVLASYTANGFAGDVINFTDNGQSIDVNEKILSYLTTGFMYASGNYANQTIKFDGKTDAEGATQVFTIHLKHSSQPIQVVLNGSGITKYSELKYDEHHRLYLGDLNESPLYLTPQQEQEVIAAQNDNVHQLSLIPEYVPDLYPVQPSFKVNEKYSLAPIVISAGSAASARLKVTGQSTVKTLVHYQDATGDHYVELPDKAKTYNELSDTMKRSDFMQSDDDLAAADKALLPAHFVINWSAQPTIENLTNTYLNGYQNGTAEFGKLVKYDFDGDRVVFEGAIEPQVTENKAVKRTIHYKYADGTTAKPDVVQTSKQFINIGFKNPFTDEITWATNIDSDTLAKVDSPLIAGYRVDKNSVNAITVNVNSNDSEETVVYTSDIQHATINYIDDTTGKTLKSDNVSGNSDSVIDYQTKGQIDQYASQHYVLVSNDFNDGHESYDHDNSTTQVFNVHLKHDTQTVNDSQTKKLVVHYIYAKDQPKSGQAYTDQSANEIVFTRTGTTDLVTNNTAWNAWDNVSRTFDAIDSPTIAGYTPDIISVNGVVITPDGRELTEKTVTYKADSQKAVVNYIDDVAKQTLKSDQLSGLSGANVNYTTKNLIDSYRRQGYEVVSDDTKGDNLVFDTDANVDQIYNVHLTHHKSDTSRQSIVNETINYVFAKDNKQAAPSYHAKAIVFTQTGTKDDVTGEVVWEPINSQSFASVKSPLIAGYTAKITEVPAVEVHFGDEDAVKTVTYKANQQKLDVVFIDDVTGQVFKTVTKTGDSDTNSGYSTKADIDGYKANHYDLTSDSTNGKSLVFDHDDTKDQHYEVHLTHHQSDVSRQSTVNEVIHYVYADGNKASDDYVAKPISFTQTGTKDDVADTIVWNKVDSQQFAKIASPVIDGYTPDLFEVSAQTVSFGDQDIVKTVTYHANEQRLKVVFIDDTDNKMLQTINKIGSSDTDSGYNTKADVDGYVTKHYVLVSDDTDGKSLVFDHADDQDQYYEVHLKHGVHNINDVSKVSERIVYQLKDGAKVFGDYLTSVSFTRDGYHDDVTDLDHWNAWQPGDSQVFAKVDSPQKQGYTPDRIQIEAIDVKPGDKDVNKVVIYTPDEQEIVVNYIDDDAKKLLHTDNLTGVSDQVSDYVTNPTIDNFVSQHYVLVSDDTKDQKLVFDHDDDKDQVYNVHFKHAHQQVTDNSKVNEVVHYVFADGKRAYADFNAWPIEFTRTGSKDLVTNEIIWNNWTSDNQQFNEVISPIITGYTPSMTIVNAIKVNAGDKDVVQTVTYVPNKQAMVINYIDDVTGKTLHTDTLTGVSDQTSDYTIKPTIDNYVSQHYKLVSDDTKGQVLMFDHDDAKTQVYNVHLTHSHSNVSRQSVVNETVNYVYQGGVTAADSYKAKPIVFVQTGDKDNVTGEIAWDKVDLQQFAAVKSPVIEGFTPDVAEVPVQTVNFGDDSLVKTVTYKANSQKLVVDFIDDTTGKVLQSVVKYGLSNESSDYNTVSDINKCQGMHYDLVSDNTDQKNLFFDHDDSVDQHYEVHLKHHIDNVTDNKQVTEIVYYRYQDGTNAANDKVMAIDFTRKGQHDLVTDKITWDNWTPDKGEFDAVESPEIDGYTPDIKVVDGVVVTADSDDLDKVVTYNKNKVIIPDIPEKTPEVPATEVNKVVETPKTEEKTVFKPVVFNMAKKKDIAQRLPQTGNKNSIALSALGFIGLTTGLGFAMRRKHD